MAAIEELIKNIADPRLREQIADEVAKLKAGKKFGLVFEEHLPEVVRLPSLPVKRGVRVVKKADSGKALYRVVDEISSRRVRIAPDAGGEEEAIAKSEVVVAKAFGEPMYPALVPVDSIERAPGKPWHVLINSDNYHALQLLLYGYEDRVDMIYIDPPYNTGAKDWKYNNDFVDTNDRFRHSKWLSMMKKRLQLAARLLSANGVLVCAIDENEHASLSLLLSEVFPSHEAHSIAIVHNPRGIQGDNFSYCHEYAVFVVPAGSKSIAKRPLEAHKAKPLMKTGGVSKRETGYSMFYPIYVKDGQVIRVGEPPKKSFHPAGPQIMRRDGEVELWPLDSSGGERKWRYKSTSLKRIIHRVEIRVGRKDRLVPYLRKTDEAWKTVWAESEYDAAAWGSTLVKRLVKKEFPFPKSMYAVRDVLLAVTRNRKDALVLDFFAGSATTLHSLALLNAADGGQRRCILVTNNEVGVAGEAALLAEGLEPGSVQWERHGLCESITWPRITAAFKGRDPSGKKLSGEYDIGRPMADGFAENAAYFRLDFLDPSKVVRGDKFEAIVPILWMLAGCQGECTLARGASACFMPPKNPFAVLIKEDHFTEFKKRLAKREDITHIFIVTDSVEGFQDMARELGDEYRVIQLYKSYLDTFKINLEKPGTVREAEHAL